MAMLIAWQTINAVRHPGSRRFTRGFLVVTPGLTIRDRLRVLQPNDPDSYYRSRELVPSDLLAVLDRARIVIINFHAFMLREPQELSKGGRALLQGRGPELRTTETEGQMLQRVMPELMGNPISPRPGKTATSLGQDPPGGLSRLIVSMSRRTVFNTCDD